MPGLQPITITARPDDWEEMSKQLNYLIKDIYGFLDQIQGVDSSTDDDTMDVAGSTPATAWDFSGVGIRIVDTGLDTKTISGGSITVSGVYAIRAHKVETESLAATDDLDVILGGYPGEILIIMGVSGSRVVTVKNDGASLLLQADFSFTSVNDTMTLMCLSTDVWKELSRANNG